MKQKVAQDDAALQSALREPAWEETDTPVTETTSSQEQLAAKSAELLQFAAKPVEPADEFSCVKLQSVPGDTVFDDLVSVAGAVDRPVERAKVTRCGKDSCATPSTAAFLALLAEQDDF